MAWMIMAIKRSEGVIENGICRRMMDIVGVQTLFIGLVFVSLVLRHLILGRHYVISVSCLYPAF